ncbi:MAG TPA: hypothetical protein VJ841_04055 [Candidatus Saccharimonadales bacterium]|nr:hypothetical protein [Candidatus Saccharimonadales bacterium]
MDRNRSGHGVRSSDTVSVVCLRVLRAAVEMVGDVALAISIATTAVAEATVVGVAAALALRGLPGSGSLVVGGHESPGDGGEHQYDDGHQALLILEEEDGRRGQGASARPA